MKKYYNLDGENNLGGSIGDSDLPQSLGPTTDADALTKSESSDETSKPGIDGESFQVKVGPTADGQPLFGLTTQETGLPDGKDVLKNEEEVDTKGNAFTESDHVSADAPSSEELATKKELLFDEANLTSVQAEIWMHTQTLLNKMRYEAGKAPHNAHAETILKLAADLENGIKEQVIPIFE